MLWLLVHSARRSLRRLVLAALGVAFPVATLGATLLFIDHSVRSMTPVALAPVQVEMRALATSLDVDLAAASRRLAAVRDVARVERFATADVFVTAPGAPGRVGARLFAVDPEYLRNHPWVRVESGALDGGALLTRALRNAPGFARPPPSPSTRPANRAATGGLAASIGAVAGRRGRRPSRGPDLVRDPARRNAGRRRQRAVRAAGRLRDVRADGAARPACRGPRHRHRRAGPGRHQPVADQPRGAHHDRPRQLPVRPGPGGEVVRDAATRAGTPDSRCGRGRRQRRGLARHGQRGRDQREDPVPPARHPRRVDGRRRRARGGVGAGRVATPGGRPAAVAGRHHRPVGGSERGQLGAGRRDRCGAGVGDRLRGRRCGDRSTGVAGHSRRPPRRLGDAGGRRRPGDDAGPARAADPREPPSGDRGRPPAARGRMVTAVAARTPRRDRGRGGRRHPRHQRARRWSAADAAGGSDARAGVLRPAGADRDVARRDAPGRPVAVRGARAGQPGRHGSPAAYAGSAPGCDGSAGARRGRGSPSSWARSPSRSVPTW